MGTTIWSPLCGGILSGKYNDGKIPEGSRVELMYKTGSHLAKRADIYFAEAKIVATKKMLEAIAELAKEIGCTQV